MFTANAVVYKKCRVIDDRLKSTTTVTPTQIHHHCHPHPNPLPLSPPTQAGLGTMNALGFFRERATDPLTLHITTSDPTQLTNWHLLRQKYPTILSTCVTNDWVLQSIRAQKKFSRFYEFVGANTLVIAADPGKEVFVHNRAMAMFVNKAPRTRLFVAPTACHEVVFEEPVVRGAVTKTVLDFFGQSGDDVGQVGVGWVMSDDVCG